MPTVTPPGDKWWQHITGGPNRQGIFGGGWYEGSPQNYELPEYGAMNFRYDAAAQQTQDAMRGNYYPGSPLAQQAELRNPLQSSILAQLTGSAPSVAQQQLQNTTQGNIGNAFAMAQANPRNAGGARFAMQQLGNINANAAGQAALLRAQETEQAQRALMGLRGQDIGLHDMLGRSQLGFLQGQQGLNQAVQQGNMQYERDRMNAFLNQPASPLQNIGNLTSSLAGTLTGFGALSPSGGGGGGGMPGPAASTGYGAFSPGTTFSSAPQMMYSQGGPIPGYFHGGALDSPANDVVPIMASPGEVVLPRSVTMDEDAPEKAALFVAALKKKYKMAA